MAKKICKNCGQKIDEKEEICSSCGEVFVGDKEVKQSTSTIDIKHEDIAEMIEDKIEEMKKKIKDISDGNGFSTNKMSKTVTLNGKVVSRVVEEDGNVIVDEQDYEGQRVIDSINDMVSNAISGKTIDTDDINNIASYSRNINANSNDNKPQNVKHVNLYALIIICMTIIIIFLIILLCL